MDDREYLLKLQRKYTKDDIVLYQKQEISKLQIELGQAKSYIEELEETIKNKEISPKQIEELKTSGWTKQFLENERINELLHQVKCLNDKLNEQKHIDHKKESIVWRDKYFSEVAKNLKTKDG